MRDIEYGTIRSQQSPTGNELGRGGDGFGTGTGSRGGSNGADANRGVIEAGPNNDRIYLFGADCGRASTPTLAASTRGAGGDANTGYDARSGD